MRSADTDAGKEATEKRPAAVILIGFMGTGKTASGKLLAAKLDWDFIDLDHEIERAAGLSVPEIFAERGEGGFRGLERDLLRLFCRGEKRVIAAGGGAVCDPENLAFMRKSGWLVCLEAEPETIRARLSGDAVRPLLAGDGSTGRISELLRRRLPWYRAADVCIATDNDTPGEVAEKIGRWLLDRIK